MIYSGGLWCVITYLVYITVIINKGDLFINSVQTLTNLEQTETNPDKLSVCYRFVKSLS